MAITLITGQPGNFKTALALETVEALRQSSGREVFVNGIPELTLPWQPFEAPERWMECPDGSIIVIDEAQRCFRVRSQGSVVPPHVAQLETHRHRGMDIFLVTQHPHLIDTNVRKLTQDHMHTQRRFGLERSTVFHWQEVSDPSSSADKSVAEKRSFTPKKSTYASYKSATVHTVKRRLPWKVIAMGGGALLAVVGSVAYTARHVAHMGEDASPKSHEAVGRYDASAGPPRGGPEASMNPWSSVRRAARDISTPASAPMFDSLQRVVSQPRVAGCMRLQVGSADRCTCNDAQGAVVPLEPHQCRELIRDGWFDETKASSSAKAANIAYLNSRDGSSGGGAARGASPQATSGAAP